MKITIGVPNYGEVKTEMMMSLIPNLFVAYDDHGHKIQYELECPAGCHSYKNRNKIVLSALQSKSDYVFMVDTDMVFPDGTLQRLLKDKKDIVGCAYNKRAFPLTPIHNMFREDMPQELFKVNATPSGVLLIKTDVLRVLPPPWFAVEWIEGLEFVGPDVYFCRKAEKYGYSIWVDARIEVKHIGEHKF